ncbi:hypothetical protein M514_04555 [Trichuris suis]|uniref:Uncharacterized protein n=1 Tax=Trichuris suis TaxID=68888 RepID=A0A085NIE5_9BILA|nr:hypothetical protein M513_04555 [Trichuris suis]KFD69241.1 hypothetical protein M514_04555 [Trichuris suis]
MTTTELDNDRKGYLPLCTDFNCSPRSFKSVQKAKKEVMMAQVQLSYHSTPKFINLSSLRHYEEILG